MTVMHSPGVMAQGFAIAGPVLTAAAGFAVFRGRGRTVAEAAASALAATLMLIAFVQQGLMTFLPWPYWDLTVNVTLTAVSLWIVFKGFRQLVGTALEVAAFFRRRHPAVFVILILCQGVLFIKAMMVSPQSFSGMAYLKLHGSLKSFLPTSTQILVRQFARPGLTWAGGATGYTGYLVLLFSTYSLARRYAWVPVAFTVTVIVAGFPRFVFHAAGPGFEIVPAAMAVLAILLTYRLKESPGGLDFAFLMLVLGFLSSHGPMNLIMASILTALCLVLLIRRHGLVLTRRIRNVFAWAVSAIVPMVVFIRPWAWIRESLFDQIEANPDELLGGAANLVRYFFQGLDTTPAINEFFRHFSGTAPHDLIMALYRWGVDPLLGNLGAPNGFNPVHGNGELLSWFGPLGPLLVIPAVVLAMARGPRRLKFVGVALTAYLYLVCLAAAWHPENVRFFSSVYACSGFFMAFFLPPWRLGRKGKRGIQVLALIIMAYSVAHV